tara:strand:+ start:5271 stop:6170 length:900 start_codon:yes stop_codon:yes gene_type:complete
MTLYYLQEEMGIFLIDIVNKLLNEINSDSQNDLAITWINYKRENKTIKRLGYGINNNLLIYPASIVKLVYAFATYEWIQKNRLTMNDEINEATYKMLANSSNDATSFIVDILTGTTSGPSLNDEIFNHWKYKRQIINDWLISLKWNELKGINCCQKTWEDAPYGREKDFYGTRNQNTNQMSTDGTAKILEEIMSNLEYKRENINIKNFLSRNLIKDSYIDDPNNQIEGFLGEGIPNNIPYWSKAGLMSQVRHDAAWWSMNEGNQTLLVVFGNSSKFAQSKLFLPKLAKAIYEFNLEHFN